MTVLDKLMESKSDSRCFLRESSRWLMLKSPHRIIFVDTLKILFNTESSCFKKKVKISYDRSIKTHNYDAVNWQA